MIWQAWVYVAIFAFGLVVSIANAGKPRDPYPSGPALVVQLVISLLVGWVVLSGMGAWS